MAKVILDINGWWKKEEASSFLIRSGVIEQGFYPPIPVYPLVKVSPKDFRDFITIRFIHRGEYEGDKPIFLAQI